MTSGTGEDGGHRVPDVFECFFERGGAEPNPDIRENREGGGGWPRQNPESEYPNKQKN